MEDKTYQCENCTCEKSGGEGPCKCKEVAEKE